jgi:molecular chaperone GrpE
LPVNRIHPVRRPGSRTQRSRETKTVAERKPNPFEESVEIDVQSAAARGEADDSELQEPGAEDRSTGEVASAEEALAAAEQELARHREAMLRMQADMENQRKRMVREQEKARKFALEQFMKDLLQVRDSLERGLEVEPAALTVESLKEGQELTLKMLDKVMQDHHLEVVDPAGQPFDPELHEAMTVLPSADVEENTVIEVLQKGFLLNDRLIRPARVVVSRKP